MEEPKDKIDQLFHKLIKEHGLEQPSVQFTDNLMNEWLEKPVAIAYKPILGKSGKIFILAVLILFILLSILPGKQTVPTYLEFISNLNFFSGLEFSPEFGIIFFTCSVGVWVLMAFDRFLKNFILK